MPRRKKTLKQYGEPTEMMAVRIPQALHRRIKDNARHDRMPKSRKVVELLSKALAPQPDDGGIFE